MLTALTARWVCDSLSSWNVQAGISHVKCECLHSCGAPPGIWLFSANSVPSGHAGNTHLGFPSTFGWEGSQGQCSGYCVMHTLGHALVYNQLHLTISSHSLCLCRTASLWRRPPLNGKGCRPRWRPCSVSWTMWPGWQPAKTMSSGKLLLRRRVASMCSCLSEEGSDLRLSCAFIGHTCLHLRSTIKCDEAMRQLQQGKRHG